MRIEKSDRGFEYLVHPGYPPEPGEKDKRLASQSSAIGDYEDSFDRPGTSYLWLGDNHHLNREEVAELVVFLNRWLQTGRMGEQDGQG